MLNFDEELAKFEMALEVNQIEDQIATEDIRDIMDLIKEGMEDKLLRLKNKNDYSDKEL